MEEKRLKLLISDQMAELYELRRKKTSPKFLDHLLLLRVYMSLLEEK